VRSARLPALGYLRAVRGSCRAPAYWFVDLMVTAPRFPGKARKVHT